MGLFSHSKHLQYDFLTSYLSGNTGRTTVHITCMLLSVSFTITLWISLIAALFVLWNPEYLESGCFKAQ